METNNATFQMIQRNPFPIVLPMNHPCVNNTRPAYIDKYDRVHRLDRSNILQEPFTDQAENSMQNSTISQQEAEGELTSNKESNELQNNTIESSPISENETKPEDLENGHLFGPNERFKGDELLYLDISSEVDLVENLIPYGEISVLAGLGDSGKTTLYFQLSLSIIIGQEDFFGRKINSKFNSVLIIATEDSKIRIADKIQKQIKKIAPEVLTINNLYVHITGDDLFNRIREEFKLKKFDLVVLDALGDLLADEINSQSAVRDYYTKIEKLIREFDTTFLFVQHVGKTKNRSKRASILGSVAIVDRARNALFLEKDLMTGLRALTIVKSNNISDDLKNRPIFLKLDENSLTYSVLEADNGFRNPDPDPDPDPDMQKHTETFPRKKLPLGEYVPFSEVVKSKPGRKFPYKMLDEAKKLYAQGMNLEDIGKKFGKHKSTISRWFKDHPTYDLSNDDVD